MEIRNGVERVGARVQGGRGVTWGMPCVSSMNSMLIPNEMSIDGRKRYTSRGALYAIGSSTLAEGGEAAAGSARAAASRRRTVMVSVPDAELSARVSSSAPGEGRGRGQDGKGKEGEARSETQHYA